MVICFATEGALEAAFADLSNPMGDEAAMCLMERIDLVSQRHGAIPIPERGEDQDQVWCLTLEGLG